MPTDIFDQVATSSAPSGGGDIFDQVTNAPPSKDTVGEFNAQNKAAVSSAPVRSTSALTPTATPFDKPTYNPADAAVEQSSGAAYAMRPNAPAPQTVGQIAPAARAGSTLTPTARAPLSQPAAHPADNMKESAPGLRLAPPPGTDPVGDAFKDAAVGAGKDIVQGVQNTVGQTGEDFDKAKFLKGITQMVSGGSKVAITIGAPELMRLGQLADGAVAGTTAAEQFAAKKAILSMVAKAGVGVGASDIAGAAADKYQLSPETKDLIQTAAFFLPTLAGAMTATAASRAGFKGGVGLDAEGNVGAGVETPGGTKVAVRAGNGAVEGGIQRPDDPFASTVRVGRQPAPPDPAQILSAQQAEAGTNAIIRAAVKQKQAATVVSGGPPPPPPGPTLPATLQSGVVTPQTVQDIATMIHMAPPDQHGKLLMEAHGKLTEYIQKQGRIIGPDGKLQIAETPQQAAKLAQNIINDEVDRQSQAKEDAAKQQEEVAKQQQAAQEEAAKAATTPAEDGGLSPADRQWERAKTIMGSTSTQPGQMIQHVLQRNLGVGPQVAQQMVTRYQKERDAAALPTVGSKQEPVVEESRATVDAQMAALQRGDIKVVMLPEGSKYRPRVPDGMKVMGVKGDVPGAGLYVYDPKAIQAATIRNAAKAGTHGDLMGHVQDKTSLVAAPEKPTVVVQAQTKDGTPIQDSEVHPERVEHQKEALQERHPEATIVVKPTHEVIADRIAEQEKPEVATSGDIFDEVAGESEPAKEVAKSKEKETPVSESKKEPEAAGSQRDVAPAAPEPAKEVAKLEAAKPAREYAQKLRRVIRGYEEQASDLRKSSDPRDYEVANDAELRAAKLHKELKELNSKEPASESALLAKGDTVAFKDREGIEREGVIAHAGERIHRIKSEGKEFTVPVKKVRAAPQTSEEVAAPKQEAKAPTPNEFLTSPSGSKDFGEISTEVSKSIGIPAGAIRLRQGNDRFGLNHIEKRHGEGIRKRGYPSVEAFVEHVAKNFSALYGRKDASLDMVASEGDHGRMIIHLEPDPSGKFYDVKTATPSRDDQFKNKKPLWERTGTSTTLAEASPLHPRGQGGEDSVAQTGEKGKETKYLHGGLGIAAGALKPLASIKPVADVLAFLGDEADRVAVSRDLHNRLYDLASQDNAAVLRVVQMLKEMPGTAKDQQAIYHHLEDPKSATLTKDQEELLDNYLTPLIYRAEHDYQVITEGGVPLDNYVHRQVRDRGGMIDRIMEKVKSGETVRGIGGGRLTKTAPGQKHRTMMALQNVKTGKRQVVSIKGGRVTAMRNGQDPEDLGGLRTGLTSVGEEVDKRMMPFVERVTELRDEIAGAKDADKVEQLADIQPRIEELKKQRDLLGGVNTKSPGRKPDLFDKSTVFRSSEVTFNQRAEITKKLDPLLKREEALNNGTAPMLLKNVSKLKRRKEELLDAEAARDHFLNELPPETFADKAWKDKNGGLHTITQATTKEIEANTNVRYYQNAAASVAVNYLAMDKARRAYEFLEDFKKSPEFAAASHSINSPGAIPKGWQATQLPQFRGYFFEPHIAEVLDAYAAKAAHDPGVLEKVGNFLRTSIFFNPLIHIPNLLNHWVVEKGVSGFANPLNYPTITRAGVKAINAVIHQNKDFLEALDHGAPLQSQQFETKQFADIFFKRMQDELGDPESSKAKELATALGMSPVNLVKAIYKFSGQATWYTNDIAFLQSTYEKQEKGMSLKDALTETAKHIPDYRLMTRIFDNPKLAKLMSNHNLTMFGAYHYDALKSYGQMAKSLTGFNWTDAGTKNDAGEPTNAAGRTEGEEKLHGLDTLAMMALVTFVAYPLLDKLWRAFTGNDKAQMRRAGASTFIYNFAMLAKGEKTPEEVAESVATPAVQTKALAEMVLNRDLRTGQRLYDPHAPAKKLAGQVGRQLLRSVAPVSQGMDIAEGRTDVKRLMYSMVGVSFPLHGAEKIAAQITAERMSSLPPRDEDEIAHAIQRSRALHDHWSGDNSKLVALLHGKDFTSKEKAKIRKDALLPPIVYAVRGMEYDDAMRVYHAADAHERHQLKPLMSKKLATLVKEGKKPASSILGKDDDN